MRDASSSTNSRVWGHRVSCVWGEAVNHPRPSTASSQSLLNPWKSTPKLQPLREACGAAAKTQGGGRRGGDGS